MRWIRTLQTVDAHCAGEIGRVITGGVVNVPGVREGQSTISTRTVASSRW